MKLKLFSCATLLFLSLIATGHSQGMFGPREKPPIDQLAKFFGKNQAFSATALISMKGSKVGQVSEIPVAYAMLAGKVRTEMDLTKMGGTMPAEALAHLKQMGMDRLVNLAIPEKKTIYLIYPGLKAYCEMATGNTAASDPAQEAKVDKTELGKETVAGHTCTKFKVTVTEATGRHLDSLVWEAADLKDFPIKFEMTTDEGQVVTMQFSNINQNKPDAALFEVPSGYTQYGSMQELMMGNMNRLMPAHGGTE